MKTRPIAAIAAALVLTAPALAGEDEYAQVHAVAIVSTLSSDLHWETTGLTRFDYKDEPLQIDWDVDGYVARSIVAALHGRFAVRNTALPHALFAGEGGLSRSTMTSLHALPESAGVDAYIVVRPAKMPFLTAVGIAISHHHGAFGRELTDLYSAFDVDVIDARTGDRIDYGTANSPIEHAQWGLMERCDNDIWADAQAALSAQQKNRIVEAIKSAVDKSLPFALSSAKLIPDAAARELAAPAVFEPGSATCHPI